MKQTQKDFNRGYQNAVKDIENMRKEQPNISDEDIRFQLLAYAPHCPSFWYKDKNGELRYKIITTKYAKGYEKACSDLLKEVSL